MEIILNPPQNNNNDNLKTFYKKALSEGIEIGIISAYLTSWDSKNKLNRNCRKFSFIVGTDFGITKKDACQKVLKWLRPNLKNDFCAADNISGFHPKLIIWRNHKNECYTIIGSSNLTQAAFESNYEANVYLKIDSNEFNRLKNWIYQIKSSSTPISEDWLRSYSEIKKKFIPKKTSPIRVINIKLPKGVNINKEIINRRKQRNTFSEIEDKLKVILKQCASERITNKKFYERLMEIWGHHKSRFQGQGFQIKGKNGNWQEVCDSLVKILSEDNRITDVDIDDLVKKEIDKLAKKNNPNRKAWFTEMLCHFYPDKYPLVNKPVETWLKHIRFRSPRKSSEGSRYIDLSIKLRQAVKENTTNNAKDLSELDGAISCWYFKHL